MEKRFQLGISALDEQHEALVGMLNAFQLAVAARRPADELSTIADTALVALRAHFQYEEALMAKSAYPAAAEHRFQHERLTLSAASLIHDALDSRQSPDILTENLDLLQMFALSHIRREDRALAEHLISLGMG